MDGDDEATRIARAKVFLAQTPSQGYYFDLPDLEKCTFYEVLIRGPTLILANTFAFCGT